MTRSDACAALLPALLHAARPARLRLRLLVTPAPINPAITRRCLASVEATLPKGGSHPAAPSLPSSLVLEPPRPVVVQLDRVAELQQRTAAENSKAGKARIIGQYPDLRELLELIYAPNIRLHLSPGPLKRYLAANGPSKSPLAVPDTVVDLFRSLTARTVTGNDAKAHVAAFLIEHGIVNGDYITSLRADKRDGPLRESERVQVFWKLMERNLVAGFGANTLREVQWRDDGGDSPTRRLSAQPPLGAATAAAAASRTSGHVSRNPAAEASQLLPSFPDRFSCALGKAVDPPFKPLFTGKARWFASRKLDGVRCITFVDFVLPPSGPAVYRGSTFSSRAGNAFTTLGNLETQLRRLAAFPALRVWLDEDAAVAETDEGAVKRLVLDGEVCVMRELSAAETANRRAARRSAAALWDTDHLTEDFAATVSLIRRKAGDISHPAYFLLDTLPYADFAAAKAVRGQTFAARARRADELARWLAQQADDANDRLVRPVTQWEVTGPDAVDDMVRRAADEGWEGLVFRADKPYVGKRSSDVLKFKQWKDAEYMVTALDKSRMRLAVDGVFAEHDACANVWVEHDGHPVSVGSGFTADQRLRYARDPSLIVGKQITVQYFGESESSDRGQGIKSLRFPRVKQVWEDGRRDI
ncbi:hypothetical protein Q5752_000519 [Cryptotrichosporon argae]